jgi:glycosyltransferase involved in cell wall biosynthesis
MSVHVIEVVSSVSAEASGLTQAVLKISESVLEHKRQHLTIAALDLGDMGLRPSYLNVFPVGFCPKKLGCSPKMLSWLDEQAKHNKVQLIHSHSLWVQPVIYPARVKNKYNIPLLVSPHGTLSPWAFTHGSIVKKIYWPFLQKPALDVATCFHATALSEYNDIRSKGFRQPVALIPLGIDIPSLQKQLYINKRTLLFLGRIHPKKGLNILLPAWAALQERYPEWCLRIVGPDDGGYLQKMLELSKKLSLKRIEFSGTLFGEKKIHAYQQADLFVLPTYSENFGISVAEALASGTPALVTKGAPWEGLETHNAGMWIEIGLDPLVAALERMMSLSRDELDVMGMNGRSWMDSEYSWSSIGAKMAETYEWIINEGEKPGWVINN